MFASWRSERGTASMEAMFIFPILMVGFFMLQKTAGIMAAQEHAAVSVRTAAWSHALHRGYEDPILTLDGLAVAVDLCEKTAYDATSDATFDVTCDADALADRGHGDTFRKDVIEDLGTTSATADVRNAAIGLTSDLDDATPPLFSKATAEVAFTPIRPALVGGGIVWSIAHTVGANQSWQLKDLPKGYDTELKDRLRGNDGDTAEDLYADLF